MTTSGGRGRSAGQPILDRIWIIWWSAHRQRLIIRVAAPRMKSLYIDGHSSVASNKTSKGRFFINHPHN